jgi:hydroxymethylglutaryl-CoA reductase
VQEGGLVAAQGRGERIARPTANATTVRTRGDAMRRAVETRVRTAGLYS